MPHFSCTKKIWKNTFLSHFPCIHQYLAKKKWNFFYWKCTFFCVQKFFYKNAATSRLSWYEMQKECAENGDQRKYCISPPSSGSIYLATRSLHTHISFLVFFFFIFSSSFTFREVLEYIMKTLPLLSHTAIFVAMELSQIAPTFFFSLLYLSRVWDVISWLSGRI